MMFFRSLFSTILLISIVIIAQGVPNICDWIKCENAGKCEEVKNTTMYFRCQCQFGFTGLLCESRINITACATNPCNNNGACTITANRVVQCTCSKQYTGSRCEIKLYK